MRIVSCALLLMASLAFVLGGCSDNSNSVVAPTSQALAPPGLGSMANTAGLHSATGSAPLLYLAGYPVDFRFNFTAVQIGAGSSAARGEVEGSGHETEITTAVKYHGKIFDLKVDHNNTWAKLFWVFTDGPWAGQYGIIVVIDNGEGKNAAGPDMVSWLFFAWGNEPELGGTTIQELVDMSPTQYVAWTGVPFEVFFSPIDFANVQVK